MLVSPSGVVFTKIEPSGWHLVRQSGNRINLHIPEMLAWIVGGLLPWSTLRLMIG